MVLSIGQLVLVLAACTADLRWLTNVSTSVVDAVNAIVVPSTVFIRTPGSR